MCFGKKLGNGGIGLALKVAVGLPMLFVLCGGRLQASSAPDEVERTLRYLLKYGRNWAHPSDLIEDGLPHSISIKVAGKVLTFQTDHSFIALQASRARLLMRDFGAHEAGKWLNPQLMRVIVQAKTMPANLIWVRDGIRFQPGGVGDTTTEASRLYFEYGFRVGGFLFSAAVPVEANKYTTAFDFLVPQPFPAKAEFILIASDGKRERLSVDISEIRDWACPRAPKGFHTVFAYDYQKQVKVGSNLNFRLQIADGKSKNISSRRVLLHPHLIKCSDGSSLPVPKEQDEFEEWDAAFRFDLGVGTNGGGYRYDLPTKGLKPGAYKLLVLVEDDAVAELPFNLK